MRLYVKSPIQSCRDGFETRLNLPPPQTNRLGIYQSKEYPQNLSPYQRHTLGRIPPTTATINQLLRPKTRLP